MNGLGEQITALKKRNLRLEQLLTETELQLYRWAKESQGGGWSTHQVDPMEKWAQYIRMVVLDVKDIK